MNRPSRDFLRRPAVALALAAALGTAAAATVDISNTPLVTGSSTSVKPNVLFILDDSGSMDSDYVGDEANNSSMCRSGANCGGGGNVGNPLSFAPPFMAKEFNGLAYNPETTYSPPPDHDGTNTTYKSYDNSVAGQLWTAVKLSPFNSSSTYDLLNNYPERVYCLLSTDSASDRVRCRRNIEKLEQPAFAATVSSSSTSAGNTTLTINTGAQPGSTVHACHAGESITIAGLSVSAANGLQRIASVPSGTSITYTYAGTSAPANGSTLTMTACHQIFSASITRSSSTATLTLANHGCQPGDTIKVAGVSTSTAANANFNGRYTVATVPSSSTLTYALGTTFGATTGMATTAPADSASPGPGITVSSCPLPLVALSRAGTVATATFQTAHGCVAGDTVTITGASTASGGAAYNLTNAAVTGVPAPNQLTYTVATSAPSTAAQASAGVPIRITTCPATASNYSVSTSLHPQQQGFPLGNFTNTRTRSGSIVAYTIYPLEYCSSNDMTTCDSQVQTSSRPIPAFVRYCNTDTTARNVPGSSSSNSSSGTASTSSSGTGCQRPFAGAYSRARYGYFVRHEIVSTTTSYPKASTRTDCAAATCTYNEEMTNFANWFSYYRARRLMMKSATGRAFHNLNPTNVDDTAVKYRVGFMTINVSSTYFHKILPFGGGSSTSNKAKWFDALYDTTFPSSTPLRYALGVAGRYYAGNFTSTSPFNHDPIEYSCQPNIALLTTDGYWNGSGGVKLNNSTYVGNQDGASQGVARPFRDASNTATSDGAGTLADVAYYYYTTPLRTALHNPTNSAGTNVVGDVVVDTTTGAYVSGGDVPTTSKDTAKYQHMTTFTMGLGLDSLLAYAKNYDTAGTSADYNAIVSGSKDWPAPSSNNITAIDDLWHAAVNGRGTYFSARDPAAVIEGITSAFASLGEITGSAAAAATSNPNIQSGDNFLFASTYTTQEWSGEVTRQQIDLNTGTISSTIDWTAQSQLDLKTSATRTIYTFDSTNANSNFLKNFTWSELTAAERAYFGADTTSSSAVATAIITFNALTQVAQQNNLLCTGCGAKVVEYLRGDNTYRATTNSLITPDTGANALFRFRDHLLGDIVSAEAVYVKKPPLEYNDAGHSTFRTTGTGGTRSGRLYVAANDGMLHALNSDTGAEEWAYIPSMVLPNLYNLTRKDYKDNHSYFVDGTPVSGDICTANCSSTSLAVWKTILVAGLNAGGRGYYALDITNPTSPKALWELKSSSTCIPFKTTPATDVNIPEDPVSGATGAPFYADCDIGLSFGNPVITKRKDGKWVVLVSSGYNNVSPGTGGGFLYVVDAATGEILNKIPTLLGTGVKVNAGTTTTPSGLVKINAFAESTATDNTSLRIYGGDLNGNLWRFDNNNEFTSTGMTAKLLTYFGGTNADGLQGDGTQPITSRPELGRVVTTSATYDMVFIGTGKYLHDNDKSNVSQQSFYAVKDPLTTNPNYGSFRSLIGGTVVQQTLTETSDVTGTFRFTTSNAVDLASKKGWVIDFNPGGVSPGERSYTDATLDLGTVTFTTNVPTNTTSCSAGGSSYIYFVDYSTGGPVSGSTGGKSGQYLGKALATRPVVVRLPTGKLISLTRLSTGTTVSLPIPTGTGTGAGKRVSWREVNTDQ